MNAIQQAQQEKLLKQFDSLYKSALKAHFGDRVPKSFIDFWLESNLRRRLELYYDRIMQEKFGLLCRKCGINATYHPCNEDFKKVGKEFKQTGTIKRIKCPTCGGRGQIGA